MEIKPIHRGSCHCGSVQFEVTLPNGLEELRRCNCSMCRRRGAVAGSVSLDGLRVTSGEDKLSLYQFNTMTAEHFFCSVCGIYTHHKRRSNRDQFGFNVACLEGINPFELGEIPIVDGINHPCDR
ncbi:MAG: GFA family protein [Gammaproteobacteria bacterium]|nr:GFA family protein [Gammaproteobacteria bacterium]